MYSHVQNNRENKALSFLWLFFFFHFIYFKVCKTKDSIQLELSGWNSSRTVSPCLFFDKTVTKQYLLTPWGRVLLEKLTGPQLVKKFPAYYGTQRFITAFTRASHLSLSWAISIQFMANPTSWWSVIILSLHVCLGIPSVLFLSLFRTETLFSLTVCTSPFPHTCYMARPSYSWLDYLNNIWWELQIIKLLIM